MFKTLCLVAVINVAAIGFVGCKSETSSQNKQINAVNETIIEQLEGLKPTGNIDLATVAGNTNAEKLLYLIDAPTASKSGILIFLDAQIQVFEGTGNQAGADALRANRVLMSQAVDETVGEVIVEMAKVYEDVFTPEEILELIEIFRNPVMKKYTKSTVTIQQMTLPIAKKWGEEVMARRYLELLAEQANQ